MLATREVLEDTARAVAQQAQDIIRKDGRLEPVALIYNEGMQIAEVMPLNFESSADEVRFRYGLRSAVEKLCSEAVVVVSESVVRAEEPAFKKVILVEATSPAAEHVAAFEVSRPGGQVQPGEEIIMEDREGLLDYTRGLWSAVS